MAPHWPVEHGGTDWTVVQHFIFETEIGAAGVPGVVSFGTGMVAPVIMAFGTEAQKQYFLPRILKSEDWWCQGYSEPNAGSDLASLKMRAVRDGDDYVLNGSKTWTTWAQHADMIFCLVRTDSSGKKQQGISFILVDMTSPGITVQPIIMIDGGDEINQVFFDDVRVPAANMIGEEGKGWTYAKYLLSHERMGVGESPRSRRQLAKLKKIVAGEQAGGRPLIEDPRFRDKLSHLEIEMMALEYTNLRVIADQSAGKEIGPEASLLKIRSSEIQQRITELMFEAVGYYALPYVPGAFADGVNEPPIGPDYAAATAPTYYNYRKTSIYSGSNEIQKNIIAKWVLGL
jgi:alkylation response protein AidB-like acyl-CoA dehydrogenase